MKEKKKRRKKEEKKITWRFCLRNKNTCQKSHCHNGHGISDEYDKMNKKVGVCKK